MIFLDHLQDNSSSMFVLLFCILAAANAEVTNKSRTTVSTEFVETEPAAEISKTIFVYEDGTVIHNLEDVNWAAIYQGARTLVWIGGKLVQVCTLYQ